MAFVQVFMFASGGDLRTSDAIAAGVDDVFDVLSDSPSSGEVAGRIVARVARSQALSELALLDPLTALHNRRFMNDRLPAEIARAARAGDTLSIALVDLDDFKRINDTLGHAVGDRALVAFARSLRSSLRAYDLVCRYGGDEFVVLFPDCGAVGAEAALAQLRVLRSREVSDLPAVTFSAGVAEFPGDGRSLTELFNAADRNVRIAKQGGRSRIVGPRPSATARAQMGP